MSIVTLIEIVPCSTMLLVTDDYKQEKNIKIFMQKFDISMSSFHVFESLRLPFYLHDADNVNHCTLSCSRHIHNKVECIFLCIICFSHRDLSFCKLNQSAIQIRAYIRIFDPQNSLFGS